MIELDQSKMAIVLQWYLERQGSYQTTEAEHKVGKLIMSNLWICNCNKEPMEERYIHTAKRILTTLTCKECGYKKKTWKKRP